MPILVDNGFGDLPVYENIEKSFVRKVIAYEDIAKGDIIFASVSGGNYYVRNLGKDRVFQSYEYPVSIGYAIQDIKQYRTGKAVFFLHEIDEREN